MISFSLSTVTKLIPTPSSVHAVLAQVVADIVRCKDQESALALHDRRMTGSGNDEGWSTQVERSWAHGRSDVGARAEGDSDSGGGLGVVDNANVSASSFPRSINRPATLTSHH